MFEKLKKIYLIKNNIKSMKEIFSEFFDLHTIPFYCIGLLAFLISIIDDIIDKNKHKILWYLQELLYSILAIAIGISVCYIIELPKAACWIMSIFCGFVGPTIMRKLDENKEKYSEKALDSSINATSKKIENIILNKSEEIESEENFEIEKNK